MGRTGTLGGLHANSVSPQLQRVNTNTLTHGFILDQIADYNSAIDDCQMSNRVIPIIANGGLTPIARSNMTCGIACIITAGNSVRDLTLLPPSSTLWGIITNGNTHIDSVIGDVENSGTYPLLQMSSMNQFLPPTVEVDNSYFPASGTAAPIVIDGLYQALGVKQSQLSHQAGTTGPEVDVSKGQQAATLFTSGIDF